MEEIKFYGKRPKDAQGEDMLLVAEVCKELNCGKTWLSQQCNRKRVRYVIPHRRIGKFYWFSKTQIQQWNSERQD